MKRIALILTAVLFATDAIGQASNDIADRPPDHLMPEDSLFAGHEYTENFNTVTVAILQDLFAWNVKLRMINDPGPGFFDSQFGVGIRDDDGKYVILAMEPSSEVYTYKAIQMMESGTRVVVEADLPTKDPHVTLPSKDPRDLAAAQAKLIAELKAELPSGFHDATVERCEVSIEPALANRIIGVWTTMLMQTHYPTKDENDVEGLGGETYHFAMPFHPIEMGGWFWGPNENTKPMMLANIGYAMRSYCFGNDGGPWRDPVIRSRQVYLRELEEKVTVLENRLAADGKR